MVRDWRVVGIMDAVSTVEGSELDLVSQLLKRYVKVSKPPMFTFLMYACCRPRFMVHVPTSRGHAREAR